MILELNDSRIKQIHINFTALTKLINNLYNIRCNLTEISAATVLTLNSSS